MMVAILAFLKIFLKFLPIIGSLLVAGWILLSSIGDFFQGDRIAPAKAIGGLLTGSQNEMINSVDAIKEGRLGGYFTLIGTLLLTFMVFKFFMYIADKFFSFESVFTQLVVALIVFSSISVFYNVLSLGITFDNINERFGEVIPFKGIFYLFNNLNSLLEPIKPYMSWFVNQSIKNPVF